MATLRESFEANYIALQVPANNKKGYKMEYVYYGPWYKWKLTDRERPLYKFQMGSALFLCALIYLFTGIQYCNVNYNIFVVVPSMASLAAFLFEILGVVQFCLVKERTTKINFEDINLKLRASTVIHTALLSVTSLCCIGVMIFQGFSGLSLAVTVGYMVCAALSAYIYMRYHSIEFHTEKNTDIKGILNGVLAGDIEQSKVFEQKLKEMEEREDAEKEARKNKRRGQLQKVSGMFTDAKFTSADKDKKKKK